VNAAARAAARALAHPVLRRAAACGQRGDLRRETPLLFEREDGSLAEGVVDLAFREADGWTVVDFKTDRDVAAQRAVYAAQVGLYAEGIALATGDPARGLLLVV
jgi:ATP-dependent helicase/nuclease subunit A